MRPRKSAPHHYSAENDTFLTNRRRCIYKIVQCNVTETLPASTSAMSFGALLPDFACMSNSRSATSSISSNLPSGRHWPPDTISISLNHPLATETEGKEVRGLDHFKRVRISIRSRCSGGSFGGSMAIARELVSKVLGSMLKFEDPAPAASPADCHPHQTIARRPLRLYTAGRN